MRLRIWITWFVFLSSLAGCSGNATSVSAEVGGTSLTKGSTSSRPDCLKFSFFAQSGEMADHAPTPDEALTAWIAHDYTQRERGAVTFSSPSTPDASGSSPIIYELTQTGQRAGDVTLTHDADGWFVASGHPCEKWSDATTTSTDPSNNTIGRIADSEAGLSYDRPAGWHQQGDLLSFFTTGISSAPADASKSNASDASVVAGVLSSKFTVRLTPANVDQGTVAFAKSFSEFVFAGAGHDDVVIDRDEQIDGHHARHVRLHYVGDESGHDGYLDAYTIVRGDNVSFVIAFSQRVETLDTKVSPIISSIRVAS